MVVDVVVVGFDATRVRSVRADGDSRRTGNAPWGFARRIEHGSRASADLEKWKEARARPSQRGNHADEKRACG